MSMSGSFGTTSMSAISMADLPNLPGVRRDISTANPNLYKQFKASRSQASLVEEPSVSIEEDNSLQSFFEGSSRLQEMSRTLSAFPSQADAFNDINGRYSMRSQQQDRLSKSRSLPYCSLETVPPFVANNSRICRFLAFFEESAPENLLEPVRSRKVEIVVFLDDNTIEIREPRMNDSGLTQGKLLKRHQVLKPPRTRGMPPVSRDGYPFYTLDDFYSGAQLNIYNRVYTIIDCDNVTLQFMEDNGFPFGDKLGLPNTFYDASMRRTASRASPTKRTTKSFKSLSFFEYDKKILRFYGVWDNRQDLFGDELKVRVHYSLSDQSIEVVPIHTRNSGRDRLPKFLKKSKLLKQPGSATGDLNDRTLSSSMSEDISSVVEAPRPYHWKDLAIGAHLTIAALDVLITDADEFTREFYKSKNRDLGPGLVLPPTEHPGITSRAMTAAGGALEEDSVTAASKGSFIPVAPPKDGAKAKLFQGMILRYCAVLDSPKPADVSRRFIIQVHLEDDSVQIREPPQRNTGHKGGIFLSRDRVENKDTNKYMVPSDIYVGAVLNILAHRFKVEDADEYTLKYMESNDKIWCFSALNIVTSKLKQREEVLSRLILTMPGLSSRVVDISELELLFNRAGLNLVKQEILTLFRTLDPTKTGTLKLTKMLKFLLDTPPKSAK